GLLPTLPGAAAGVVLAATGYPDAPLSGDPITGVEEARAKGALVFCAGVAGEPGDLRTAGGRVLTVVGRGPAMTEALADAYGAAAAIRFPGMRWRSDIGRSVVPAGAVA